MSVFTFLVVALFAAVIVMTLLSARVASVSDRVTETQRLQEERERLEARAAALGSAAESSSDAAAPADVAPLGRERAAVVPASARGRAGRLR